MNGDLLDECPQPRPNSCFLYFVTWFQWHVKMRNTFDGLRTGCSDFVEITNDKRVAWYKCSVFQPSLLQSLRLETDFVSRVTWFQFCFAYLYCRLGGKNADMPSIILQSSIHSFLLLKLFNVFGSLSQYTLGQSLDRTLSWLWVSSSLYLHLGNRGKIKPSYLSAGLHCQAPSSVVCTYNNT